MKTLDARGYIVFAGGIDMHSHFAGPKVNVARRMRPETHRNAEPLPRSGVRRSGACSIVPNTFTTGCLYAGLGYTAAFDAAVPALFARHAHEEMQDTPCIDKGFLVLAGNSHYAMDRIREGADDRLDAFLAWLVSSAKAFGVKAVNPGGIEEWKQSRRRRLVDVDDEVHHFRVTPRKIVRGLAASLDRLGLPHPLHIHCNNLGAPGNWKTTLATMQALEGSRGHMAHIQFHSYGGEPDDHAGFRSAVPELVEYIHSRPEITFDVGHVTFGATTSLTGDGPLGHFLHQVTGDKWFSSDSEMESGCGIVPIEYRPGSLAHSVQWAIGLEWYLLMNDPWRVALSTDHPNGGTFLKYPQTLALLMSRDLRREAIAAAHPDLPTRCVLPDVAREYTLYDVAALTRAAPARMLGLRHKGHLGNGADADLTLYQPQDDVAKMFAMPRYVVKAGEVIVDDGELRGEVSGETIYSSPECPEGAMGEIREWFEEYYSVQFENYGVEEECLMNARTVPCNTSGHS